MMLHEYLSLSYKNVKRRKLRSWLTTIGIVISIATIFILISVSLGLNSAVQEQFRQLGTDKFFIMPKGQLAGPGSTSAAQLTPDDINTIKKISGVKDYSYFAATAAQIEFVDQIRFINVIGIPLDHAEPFTESGFMEPMSGRIIVEGDTKKVVIGSQYAGDYFKKPIKSGDTVKINGESFRVKAILKTVGNPSDDRAVYMSLDDFEELFPNKKDVYDEIIVQTDAGVDVNSMAEKIEKQLRNSRGVTEKTQDFTILTPEELLATFGTVLNLLTGFLLGIAAISLLVGGIGITNTMYTAVIERTKEIGVMKAVGATNGNIVALFTIESGLIGLIGGAGGVVLGFIAAKGLQFFLVNILGITLLQAATPWYLILGSLLFSFLIGAISGVIPAYRASRIRTVVALRYE